MVRFRKILKACNGNNLLLIYLLAFIIAVHFTIKLFEFTSLPSQNCTYNEPIDVVYTWVNGSDPLFEEEVNKYLNLKKERVDSSKKRYEDKNELRFSLRSLEIYAPWINHVYLVTNGQIPYWLNLDYEKITIVTHDLIFKDSSNLPSFSSPAIESNLHRIPGLSKKFIYFNDDIFIGQPLYPEDFYLSNKGYLVFLAYPVPSCATNCPWLYVGDGQCDLNCNNAKCQFDGGDCSAKENRPVIYADQVHSQEYMESHNEKVNQELKDLKEKLLEIGLLRNSALNANASIIRVDNSTKRRYKTDTNFQRKRNLKIHIMPNEGNKSISRLVEEHNRKVLGQYKKLSRRKRSLNKNGHISNSIRTFLGSSAKNIDGFLESLLYTQRLLNKKYGYKPRYVPAHAPIFLDKDIMQGLEDCFATEFELTERNRFRHKDDMQFGFSYYYFLMSETTEISVGAVFDQFDTDNSGTWSDREIRNLLTKIYELPLSYEIVDHFEGILLNCSEIKKYPEVETPPYERYVDSRLPTISKEMIIQCPFLSEYLKTKFGHVAKYKYEMIKEAENNFVTFRMLISNITNVVLKLDEIRSKMTKFVCLNDNLDESKAEENELVRAILYDFYLALFPHPSKFELPENSRNRFLHMNELEDWKRRHFMIRIALCLAIVSLVIVTFFNALKKGCCKMFSELFKL